MSFGERCANTMQKQNISSSQQSIMGEKTSSTGRLDERENRLNGNITFCPAVIFPHYLHSIVDTVRDRFGFIQRLFSVPCFLKSKKTNVCKCVFANPILQVRCGPQGKGVSQTLSSGPSLSFYKFSISVQLCHHILQSLPREY